MVPRTSESAGTEASAAEAGSAFSTPEALDVARYEGVRLEELDLPHAMRECSPEWPRFSDAAGPTTPFARPEYLELWARTFRAVGSCRAVVARRQGRLIGFGPFMVGTDAFGPLSVPTLRFIGNNVGYPGDVLYSDIVSVSPRTPIVRAILERVSRWHARKWDFGYVPVTSESRNLVRSLLGGPVNGGLVESKPYAVLNLPPTWDGYARGLSANARRNFRRRLAKLRDRGVVDVRVAREPERVERTIQELVRNHRRWWAGTERAAWFSDDSVERFHSDAGRLLAARGEYLAFALELNGEPIAWNAGAFDGTRYFEQIISFDRTFTDVSPGVLLGFLVAERILALGGSRIELGPGMDERKSALGAVPVDYEHLHGYMGWVRALAGIHRSWQERWAPP